MSPSQIAYLKADFNLIMDYYEVTQDEAKFEKARVLANLEEASKCYSIIAAGIRNGFN